MDTLPTWLRGLGLERYAAVFADNGVDLNSLRLLTDGDLEKLGVLLGHRRTLLEAIDTLRGTGKIAPPRSPDSYTPKHLAEKILTSKSALEGERKQVTVLFADLKGSMELLADRDPEEARKILDPVLQRMMEAVHHYEGTVNQVMGDGIMALFGAPLAHEDHAVRACYAALRMQQAIGRYGDELRRSQALDVQIRVGLNSGEVVVRSVGSDLRMDYSAVGATTHVAARMEQLARPGTTLLSADTLKLVEGYVQVRALGAMQIKGVAQPVEVYELAGAGSARTRLQAAAVRGLTRFAGRQRELEVLSETLASTGQGKGQVVAIVGEPGVGKSRLYYEFTHSHRTHGWLVVEAGSVPYGKATPYLPVIELLKGYFKIGERDDARVIREKVTGKLLTLDRALEALLSPLLSLLDQPVDDESWQRLDPPQRRRQTLDALKRLCLREAQAQPLILVFEDLHWMDGETQAFLDGLLDSVPTAHLLLLFSYRPEYRHPWGGKSYYTQLRLDPLTAESAEDLLQSLLGASAELQPLKQLLIARTEGNPFFLEESVRGLVEAGALGGTRGSQRLVRPLASIEVPATVQAILAARIDRLATEDKRLLQTAAVIGKDVPDAILQAIAELPEAALRRGLGNLQAAEFVYEASLFPDLEYTFKHALTHDVAYASLLQDRRRELHARIVEAIERCYPDRVTEHIDQLAHHAFRGEVWGKALRYLRESGARSVARSAYVEALAAFEAALAAAERLPDDRYRTELMVDIRFDLRSALWPLGELERAAVRLREAQAYVETLGDPRRHARLLCLQTVQFEISGDQQSAIESGLRAVAVAAEVNDRGLEAVASLFLGQAYYIIGEFQEAKSLLERSIDLLLQGDLIFERLGMLALPSVLARAWLAWALAEVGDFEAAQARADEAVRIAEAVTQPWSLIFAYLGRGVADLRKGEVVRATSVLERALELCQRSNIPLWNPFAAAHLGHAYQLAGRSAEANTLLDDAIKRDATGVLMFGRALRVAYSSEAYLRTGHSSEAIALAARSLELSRQFGERGHEAWALRCHAEIHAQQDSPAQAEDFYRQCLLLAERLGMRPLVAHCHFGLGKLYKKTSKREQAREHFTTATTMYREMDMRFWLEQAELEMKEAA